MTLQWRESSLDIGLFVMRAGLGLMLVFVHGGPKLLDGLERWTRRHSRALSRPPSR